MKDVGSPAINWYLKASPVVLASFYHFTRTRSPNTSNYLYPIARDSQHMLKGQFSNDCVLRTCQKHKVSISIFIVPKKITIHVLLPNIHRTGVISNPTSNQLIMRPLAQMMSQSGFIGTKIDPERHIRICPPGISLMNYYIAFEGVKNANKL